MDTYTELTAILEATSDAILTIDSNGWVVSVNPSACRLLGYTPPELIGRDFSNLVAGSERLAYIDPEPAPVPSATDDDGRCDIKILHRSGVLLPVRFACRPYDAGGARRRVVILSDRSEFTRQRDELETLALQIDRLAVGVIQHDIDYRILAWSRACEDIFGWSAEEVIGRTCEELDFIHPEDRHFLHELSAGFTNPDCTTSRLFYRNITKSGRTVYIDWFNSLTRTDDGRITNLAIAIDQTAKYEAEKSLEEERQLFVTGPTMVFRWRHDADWPIDYASPNVETILGYRQADFLAGRVPGRMCSHPDDHEQILAEFRRFRSSGQNQWTFTPYRMLTSSGQSIWVKTFALRIQERGSADRYVSYSVDISHSIALQDEARLQQERLINVIEATDAGTWEWVVDTGAMIFNERWAEIIGYTLDELTPTTVATWERFVHPEDLEVAHKLRQEHFDGHTSHFEIECRMRHKAGHWVWVLDCCKVVERDNEGKPRRVAGTHIDISKRKAAEASVLAMNEALTQSNIELERFAYIASHDLQEPLRMVASFTQLLSKKYAAELDSTAQEYIYYAVDGAQRMQQLIRDLLAYSRLGRQIIEEKPVDMAALTARVLQSLKLAIDESDAEVTCCALPVVRGDAGQLFRVMQNLIANSIKYRSDESPRIAIEMAAGSDERVFCVRDNGIGIDAQHAGRIFEVFQRVQSKAKYPGTGIGLSVCKRVVERHGGRIWFESKRGSGTTFSFSLAADRYSNESGGASGNAGGIVAAEQRRPARR